MTNLAEMKSVGLKENEQPMSDSQVYQLMPQVPDWQLKEADGEKCLERVFKFKDFAQALAFTDKVGAIAEKEDHHPRLITEWGKVTV